MINTISRYQFGYKDDNFEGYVFQKDESYPVAQLHMYGDYYTFFWRGGVNFPTLVQCLGDTIRDVSRRKYIPFEVLAQGTASYGLARSRRNLLVTPYTLEFEHGSEESPYLLINETGEMDLTSASELNFARFDVESGSLRQPIILWADLNNVPESEIGFSTLDELPAPVLRLFQNTCRVEISNSELEEISGQVVSNIFAGVR